MYTDDLSLRSTRCMLIKNDSFWKIYAHSDYIFSGRTDISHWETMLVNVFALTL